MKIINTANINEARKQIQKQKKDISKEAIIIQAKDNEFNRKIVENKDVNILLSPELNREKDKLKQRSSGLNEVLCKIAKKNDISIGIDLNKIAKLSKKQKAITLSKLKQNIFLCKKAKTKIKILNSKNKSQDSSLLLALKAGTKIVKEAIN